jgi:uncharacterized Zn-finger protein
MSNTSDSQDPDLRTPNSSLRQDVSQDDLPLHCPMQGMSTWDSHPKVYIPIEDTGSALCPYCGTYYVLKDA